VSGLIIALLAGIPILLPGQDSHRIAPEIRVLCDVSSAYGDIKVIDNLRANARIMYLGQVIQTTQRRGAESDSVYDMVNYIPLLRPEAKRALLIGLGGGYIVRSLNRSGIAVHVVEIDPEVIAAARDYFDVAENDLCRIYEYDGRPFLNHCTQRYDAVIVNAFSGGDIPPHLSSYEAFSEIKRCLVPDGIVMMNCINSPDDPGGGVLGDLTATLRHDGLFKRVRAFGWKPQPPVSNYMIFASDGSLDVAAAPNRREIPVNLLDRLAKSAHEVQLAPNRGAVITDDINPLDLRQLPNNDALRRIALDGPHAGLFIPR